MTPDDLSLILFERILVVAAQLGVADADAITALQASDVVLERPKNRDHGDWATNVAMQLAGKFGMNPRAFAELVAAELSKVTGIAKVDYTPRLANAIVSAGAGATLTGQFGTTLNQWLTVPSNIDTHGPGTDLESTIRAYVDDCITRGAICGNFHHHFSTQASLRNFAVYCDQLRLRADQGLIEVGTMDDLYASLVAAQTA